MQGPRRHLRSPGRRTNKVAHWFPSAVELLRFITDTTGSCACTLRRETDSDCAGAGRRILMEVPRVKAAQRKLGIIRLAEQHRGERQMIRADVTVFYDSGFWVLVLMGMQPSVGGVQTCPPNPESVSSVHPEATPLHSKLRQPASGNRGRKTPRQES